MIATSASDDRRVLVITDGTAVLGLERLATSLVRANVSVSAIGYQSLNRSTLAAIAKAGGGGAEIVEDPAALAQEIARAPSPGVPVPATVVFLIDRSYDMRGSHMEAAKEMVRLAVRTLDVRDHVAVLAYDSEASVFVRPSAAAPADRIDAGLARLQTGVGSNVFTGLKLSLEILDALAGTNKQVILICNRKAPLDGVPELLAEMRAQKITVSAIGLADSDRAMLATIADQGDGTLFMFDDPAKITAIVPALLGREPAVK